MNLRQKAKFYDFKQRLLSNTWDAEMYYTLLLAYFTPGVLGKRFSAWVRRSVRGIGIYISEIDKYYRIIPMQTTDGIDIYSPSRRLHFIFDQGSFGCKIFDIDVSKVDPDDYPIVKNALQYAKKGHFCIATDLLSAISSLEKSPPMLYTKPVICLDDPEESAS